MAGINWLAVVAAGLSAFALGGVWYGPLFKHAWCREAGVDPDKPNRHPAAVFAGAIALSLAAAGFLGLFLGPAPELHHALSFGFHVGVFFVATSFGINYLFAGRSLKLWAIDGGYHVLQFTLYGLILGLWH